MQTAKPKSNRDLNLYRESLFPRDKGGGLNNRGTTRSSKSCDVNVCRCPLGAQCYSTVLAYTTRSGPALAGAFFHSNLIMVTRCGEVRRGQAVVEKIVVKKTMTV